MLFVDGGYRCCIELSIFLLTFLQETIPSNSLSRLPVSDPLTTDDVLCEDARRIVAIMSKVSKFVVLVSSVALLYAGDIFGRALQ